MCRYILVTLPDAIRLPVLGLLHAEGQTNMAKLIDAFFATFHCDHANSWLVGRYTEFISCSFRWRIRFFSDFCQMLSVAAPEFRHFARNNMGLTADGVTWALCICIRSVSILARQHICTGTVCFDYSSKKVGKILPLNAILVFMITAT